MKEALMLMVVCLVPIFLFGIAGYLIYKQSDGWGWFLLCATLVAGSINYSYSPNDCKGVAAETEEKSRD